jgi:DNA polymerase
VTGVRDELLSLVEDFRALITGPEPRGPERPGVEEELSSLASQVALCTRCRLNEGRRNTVFGSGPAGAKLMAMGEGPGHDEDLQGLPFVGKAGRLLTRMLASIGSPREGVYIANVVKCRPPGNRTPLPDEIAACIPYLRRQIELVRPAVILAMGNVAAQSLLKTATGITRLRGTVQDYGGTPVVPTYHPSALLRDDDPERQKRMKREAWEDLKRVRDLLAGGEF